MTLNAPCIAADVLQNGHVFLIFANRDDFIRVLNEEVLKDLISGAEGADKFMRIRQGLFHVVARHDLLKQRDNETHSNPLP